MPSAPLDPRLFDAMWTAGRAPAWVIAFMRSREQPAQSPVPHKSPMAQIGGSRPGKTAVARAKAESLMRHAA